MRFGFLYDTRLFGGQQNSAGKCVGRLSVLGRTSGMGWMRS